MLLDPAFDPTQVAYLEEAPGIAPAGHPVKGFARVTNQTTDLLEIEASTEEPAILLVTDNYAAGWQVRPAEGSTTPNAYQLLPANYCLRAIPLDPGQHHLILEYRPAGWVLGQWITAITAIAFALVGAFAFGKARFH